jgi:integrase
MQKGSLKRMRRQRGPDVWMYRWREPGPDGEIIYRNRVIGTIDEIPTRTAAFSATAGIAERYELERRTGLQQ